MTKDIYRYAFSANVPLLEIEASLMITAIATESLHGEAQVRLDAAHYFDADQRACVIDAGTPVGRDFNRIFVGFLSREFGEDTFRVERVDTPVHQEPAGTAA